VQVHWAGIDRLLDTPLWESDVALTTTSGIHAPNVAQYVMAQILAWANRVPRWLRTQQAGSWPAGRWESFMPDELAGRTLGIIGYGSIGREIARLARAFNMTILVTKRDARRVADEGYTLPGFGDPTGDLPTRIYPPEALRSVLAQCDYVVITLPLTPRTRHLFDESLLQTMKQSAYLINIGRGGVIDERALIRALQRGWIAGAGLDVFETEPLPDDSPLWDMQNVILTPHVSGFTAQYDERAVDLFVANLRRYLAGEPLINLVDREAGY
jgi:phosphoglycerate dehydrogenase-like enzyme